MKAIDELVSKINSQINRLEVRNFISEMLINVFHKDLYF